MAELSTDHLIPSSCSLNEAMAAAFNITYNPKSITPGNINTASFPACSNSGGRRSLLQTSTVSSTSTIALPTGLTAAAALASASSLNLAISSSITSSSFGQTYGISSAIASAGATPAAPEEKKSNLALGVGVGVGVGGAIIIAGIVAFVVLKKKKEQTVVPKPQAKEPEAEPAAAS